MFLGWVANHITVDPRVRLLVATGFFGAYTTFSTYANERGSTTA
jgi:fluoride ion exporter CrcB/FEX